MATTRTGRADRSHTTPRIRVARRAAATALVALGVALAPVPAAASAAGPTAAAATPVDPARDIGGARTARSAEAPVRGVVGGPLLASPGLVVAPRAGVPGPPAVQAASFVVADAGSGEVLAAKGAHLTSRPASTLKTLTALVLQPRLDPAQVYTARRADADMEGSRVGIVAGGTYTVQELFLGLFLRSGNDAASALANAAGGEQPTVAAMNELARNLGAYDTTARNPSGLDAPGQVTSAYDLALIGRAALANPAITGYATTRRTAFPGAVAKPGLPRPHFEIQNKQRFVQQYPGALGIKNGYTEKARGTLIAAAQRNGRTIVVTLLRSNGNIYKEAGLLADWAFVHGLGTAPVGRLVTAEELRPPAVVPAGAGGAGGGGSAAVTSSGLPLGLRPTSWARLPQLPAAVTTSSVTGVVLLGLLLGVRRRRRRSSPRLSSYAPSRPARR